MRVKPQNESGDRRNMTRGAITDISTAGVAVAPSILAADFGWLADEIKAAEAKLKK